MGPGLARFLLESMQAFRVVFSLFLTLSHIGTTCIRNLRKTRENVQLLGQRQIYKKLKHVLSVAGKCWCLHDVASYGGTNEVSGGPDELTLGE